MLSTELISLPTGFIFVCALGTLWAGRIRLTVPMLFALAWIFNFLVGGLTGVFLSDVPSDVTTHGSFFSMAHFHYTIMGGLIFAFFAAIYFWVPKMTGFELNERLGKVHFWVMFIAFNSTFGPLLVIGFLGMPRRVVTYAGYLQGANDWVSVSAFVLGASMLVFLSNLIWTQVFVRTPAASNPWGSKSIEFQLPSPVPVHDFDRIPTFGPDPYPYGVEGRLRRPAPGDLSGEADGVSELAQPGTDYGVVEREPPSTLERNLAIGSRLWASSLVFFFFAFLFAYFYLRSLNEHGLFKPKGVTAPQGWGIAIAVCLVVSAALLQLGAADQRADRRPAWRLKGLGALVLGLAAVVLQIVAWASIGFGPTDGGYASRVPRLDRALHDLRLRHALLARDDVLRLSYRYRGEPFAKAEVEPGHASGDRVPRGARHREPGAR